jgi:hypothetical protein
LVVETANRDNFNVRPTVPDDATRVTIVAHAKASNGAPVAIYQWHDDEGAVCVEATVEGMFRPIRSSEDVARGAFVDAIVSFDLNRKTLSIDELYRDLYDAIAEGKIPGVKLEGVK